jgi:hypothetical protein
VSKYFSEPHSKISSLVAGQFCALLFSSVAAFPQDAAGQSKYQDLVTRLPANARYAPSPPSLKGSSIAFYADPQSNAYFIPPMLLPDWDALRSAVKQNCGPGTPPNSVIEAKMLIEFSRAQIRSEIASLVAAKEKKDITNDQIFTFPYAWISVRTGAKAQLNSQTQKFPIRTIAEYPPGAKDTVEARALRITEPDPYLAHIYASCEELKYILENSDISGTFYAPTKDAKINAFSVEYSAFANSKQFKSMIRDEKQVGSQIVVSRSTSKGSGLNIGGHVGAGQSDSESQQELADNRTRAVSANLIADSAMSFAQNVTIRKWTEFEGQDVTVDKIADELMKFVMKNSTPINVQIERLDQNTWRLLGPAIDRTLSSQEMKQVVESSSKFDIAFSEKATIGSSEKSDGGGSANPYSASVDKQFKGVDDNGIKWQQGDGNTWVPTSITLYAVSQDKITQASSASFVDVLVKDAGMRIADLQPVATDFIPGSDVLNTIKAEVAGLKVQVNQVFPNIRNIVPGVPVGMDLQGVTGGSQTKNYHDCGQGQFVAGVNPYVEDGHIKLVLNCKFLPIVQVP